MTANRGWLAAGAAVVVPALALCWIHYRSLGELESKTRVWVRESLRHNLELVRAEVESRVAAQAGRALEALAPSDLRLDGAALRAKFLRVRESWPAAEEVFLVSGCQCLGQSGAKGKCGWLDEAFRAAPRSGELSYFHYQQRERSRCSSCHHAEWLDEREAALFVFRPIAGTAAFAGLRIPASHVTSVMAAEALAAVRRSQGEAEPRWAARFTASPETGAGQLAVPAGLLFPLWSLSGEFEGATIHSLARAQLVNAAWLWATTLVCLLAGVAFAMRAAARQSQLARMKSAFVSNVSHEMKTPLASIRAFAETLETGRVRDEGRAREYYRAIHRESLRLTGLIDNVLDLARLEAGATRLDAAVADAGELVEEVLHGFREQLRQAGFEVSLRVERPLPTVRIDRGAIGSALAGLIENAIKYSLDERRIAIRVWQAAGSVAISVADRGIGIRAAEQRRIFEKFYRADATLVHDVKGAGLGLALAREIVQAHGGGIRVESRPGAGSTFTVVLPAAETEVADEAERSAESAHR